MELIRDCLDKQVVDPHGKPLGRVDGMVLDISEGEQPQIAFIEIGALTRLNRISSRLCRWYKTFALRLGAREIESHRIPWSKAVSTSIEVVVNEDAKQSPALGFEYWLREHVVKKIPGN
jgi:sporulation protein YlmC with PRC-barrel domain